MYHVTHLDLLRAMSRFPSEGTPTDPAEFHGREWLAEERRRRRARRAARLARLVDWLARRGPWPARPKANGAVERAAEAPAEAAAPWRPALRPARAAPHDGRETRAAPRRAA